MSKSAIYLMLWAIWVGGIATSSFIDKYHINALWACALGLLWTFPLHLAVRKLRP